MKTTYLVNDIQADGTCGLIETTAEHWRNITKNNKLLPKADRRYFIKDIIREPGVFDCMIVEVPYTDYLRWDAERSQSTRNRKLKKTYKHCSLDAGHADLIPVNYSFEETVLGERTVLELRDALANWHPWGLDFLWLYLNGKQTKSASVIARKYGVSKRQARRYKAQFETFVKDFLN